MKAKELKEYLDGIIEEFGNLEVVVFRGDNTRLMDIEDLSRAGIDKDVSKQKVWIEI